MKRALSILALTASLTLPTFAHEHHADAGAQGLAATVSSTVATNESELFARDLTKPEYLHILLNPIPVYGLGTATLTLLIALIARSRRSQMIALILVGITCLSAWPVSEFGEQAYDRMYDHADEMTKQWMHVHMDRAESYVYMYYLAALLAFVAALAHAKRNRSATALSVIALIASVMSLGVGVRISQAGGQIRHLEFREGPPPAADLQRIEEQKSK